MSATDAQHCHDCAHGQHLWRRCPETVGGTFEPEYCECFDAAAAENRLAAQEAQIAALTEALRGLVVATWHVQGVGDARRAAERALAQPEGGTHD